VVNFDVGSELVDEKLKRTCKKVCCDKLYFIVFNSSFSNEEGGLWFFVYFWKKTNKNVFYSFNSFGIIINTANTLDRFSKNIRNLDSINIKRNTTTNNNNVNNNENNRKRTRTRFSWNRRGTRTWNSLNFGRRRGKNIAETSDERGIVVKTTRKSEKQQSLFPESRKTRKNANQEYIRQRQPFSKVSLWYCGACACWTHAQCNAV